MSQMSNTGARHQVVAYGRILKKDGKLTNIDLKQALLEAAAAPFAIARTGDQIGKVEDGRGSNAAAARVNVFVESHCCIVVARRRLRILRDRQPVA
jgi:hypothetical protein